MYTGGITRRHTLCMTYTGFAGGKKKTKIERDTEERGGGGGGGGVG